jgi:hypothetical protein
MIAPRRDLRAELVTSHPSTTTTMIIVATTPSSTTPAETLTFSLTKTRR